MTIFFSPIRRHKWTERLRSNTDSANPVEFFAQHGQLTGLGREIDGIPCTGPELPPLIAALLKYNVVNKATDASKLREYGCLFVTRMQLALIAALFHAMYIAVGPRERKMEHRNRQACRLHAARPLGLYY